jgi:hypothetical protein
MLPGEFNCYQCLSNTFIAQSLSQNLSNFLPILYSHETEVSASNKTNKNAKHSSTLDTLQHVTVLDTLHQLFVCTQLSA